MHLLKKYILCARHSLGTGKTVLNKIKTNNGVCVLEGRRKRKEEERKQIKQMAGGRYYGGKKATWVNAHGELQLKTGSSGKPSLIKWYLNKDLEELSV